MQSMLAGQFAEDVARPQLEEAGMCQLRTDRGAYRHVNSRPSVLLPSGRETVLAINSALERSGYPLHDIHCRCVGLTLVLAGRAARYHHVQVALTVALSLAGSRRVISEVEVSPRRVAVCNHACE